MFTVDDVPVPTVSLAKRMRANPWSSASQANNVSATSPITGRHGPFQRNVLAKPG